MMDMYGSLGGRGEVGGEGGELIGRQYPDRGSIQDLDLYIISCKQQVPG